MHPPLTFEPYVLTPLDHLMASINIFFLLTFLHPRPSEGVPVLQEGLSRTLTALPYLCGNVVPKSKAQGKSNVREVQPADNLTGSVLQVQHHEHAIGTIDWDRVRYQEYIPLPNRKKITGPLPVVRFQANIMEDGIILSMGFNHSVMDLRGAVTVLESLAACCRGVTPLHDEILYAHGRQRIAEAILTTDAMGDLGDIEKAQVNPETKSRDNEAVHISRKFTFSPKRILELKRICTALITDGAMNKAGNFLSSDDIVTALLWIGMLRARNKNSRFASKETSLYRTINVRPHLQPFIPSSYIGNATMCIPYKFSTERLTGSSVHGIDEVFLLRDVALALRGGVNAFNTQHVREQLTRVMKSDDWSNLSFGDADIEITSWRRFGLCSLNFGDILGNVQGVEVPDARIKNTGYILPSNPVSPGSNEVPPWEIRIVLEGGAMEHLYQESLFRWASGMDTVDPRE